LENKVYGLLGLSARAGKISFGTEAVLEGIEKNKIKLVIIAEDTSEKTKKKIIESCKNSNIEYLVFGNIFSNSKAIGKVNKAIIGIIDKNFAEAIISKINC
jgi:ribosomal protein L7Ae-like RNA K-turn-binding protein